MKVKTSELIGPALDWAVAKCLPNPQDVTCKNGVVRRQPVQYAFTPSTDWAQGGPIIEREEIGLRRNAPCSRGREWEASPSITAKGAGGKWGYGPTPLIAAMRCFVASRLGDEIDAPDELV